MLVIDRKGQDGQKGKKGRTGARGRVNCRSSADAQGGRGGPGGRGTNGKNGKNVKAKIFSRDGKVILDVDNEIFSVNGKFVIDASGGKGGDGGEGGDGGPGGSYKSGNSVIRGSNGPKGPMGPGGNGGNGGNITLSTQESHLLALAKLVSKGGRGGKGNPPGENGKDGICTFVYKNGSQVEKDSVFGVELESISLSFDESYLNGNLTRGSKFSIKAVKIRNVSNITVEENFKVIVEADENIKIVGNNYFNNLDQKIPPKATIQIQGNVDCEIDKNSDIGYYNLYLYTYSNKYSIPVNLDYSKNTYEIAINHRFNRSNYLTENFPQAKEKIDNLVAVWNTYKPERQLMQFTAYLLLPLIEGQDYDSEEGRKKFITLLNSLKGKLFDPEEFMKILDEIKKDSELEENLKIYQYAAFDLYKTLPKSSRKKLIDMMFLLATIDSVVEENEKQYIVDCANTLEVEEEWLKEEMPLLFEEGNSKIEASAKNDYTTYLIPGTAGIITGIANLLFFGGWMGTTLTFLDHYFLNSLFIVIAFLLSAFTIREFFFYKACHNCESTNLKVRQTNEEDSLLDKNNYQCKDCRAIGNEISGDELQLLSSDTKLCEDKNFFYEDLDRTKKIIIAVNVLGFILEPLTVIVSAIFTFYPKPIDKCTDFENVVETRAIPLGIAVVVPLVLAIFFG